LSTQEAAQPANDVTRADAFTGVDAAARRAAACTGGAATAATAAPSAIVAIAVAAISVTTISVAATAVVGPGGRGDHAGGQDRDRAERAEPGDQNQHSPSEYAHPGNLLLLLGKMMPSIALR
jgi:hypothetical protein